MEKNKSYDKADYRKKLYDTLVESYNIDKDIFDSYGEVFSLKRSRDDRDKDRDPFAGSDRGIKEGNQVKIADHPKIQGQRKRSLQAPLKTPPNLNISILESVPMQRSQVTQLMTWECYRIKSSTRVTMMNTPLTRKFPRLTGSRNLNDLQLLILIEIKDNMLPPDLLRPGLVKFLKLKNLWRFKQRYSTSVTKTKAVTYEIKWIEDLVCNLWSPVKVIYDKHAYWGISHWGPKRQHFYGFAANMTSSKDVYSKKRIIAVTRLSIMEKYDYGHLEEIEVRREDQKLYKFREGDFPRLRLQDIEDMLLLLVQQKLTNLIIDKWYALNVALCMFTRRIVILKAGGRSSIRCRKLPKEAQPYQARHIQNQRDLPRDIPLDSVEVLRYEKRSKSENKGKVLTEMELVLEQTQQEQPSDTLSIHSEAEILLSNIKQALRSILTDSKEYIKIDVEVMAISVISVSSDSSEESVGTSTRRVILFGTIPTTIPDTTPSVIPPSTHTDTALTLASPDYSPASDTEFDPSEDPSSDHIPPLPAIEPFLSSTDDSSDSDIPNTTPSPIHGTPFTEMTLSTQSTPVAFDHFASDDSSQGSSSSPPTKTSSDPSSNDLSDSSFDHSLLAPSSGLRPSHHLCSLVPSIPRLSTDISDRPSHDSSSASPSRKRSRSPIASVLLSLPIPEALSYARADLLPSP
ncbi:hypothetical protein Tco_0427311, partial [Tanacetum coccineum]